MRPRLSLAGQFLVLQLVIVLLVVIAVTGVSLAQADIVFRNTEGARLRSLAESVASNDSVRLGLVDPGTQGAIHAIAEGARGGAGASYLLVADEFRELLNGPDARQPLEIADSTVLSGRSWVGEIDNHLVAHVPVLDSDGRPIGLIAAGRRYPTLLEQLATALPNLLTYLVVGCLLGMGGSLLLSRRVKRQTLGLEAREIVGLAEHREAMLHGIKEGVVAIDPESRITLANDEAIRLLGLPDDSVGRELGSLGLNRRLRSVLTGRSTGTDITVLHADRVLVLNHTPIGLHGNSLGSVTTLRDRTEMVAMQHELDVTRYATDALHSQARAFTNRLRAIAGLLDGHRYDDARRYAGQASRAYEQIMEEIRSRVADPGVAAVLVAKASLAAAHGVDFQFTPRSGLPRLAGAFSVDVVMVLAALVDHALAGASETDQAWIETTIQYGGNSVFLAVRDSGSWGRPAPAEIVATPGGGANGSHPVEPPNGSGLGAARLVCARRGGELGWHPEQGLTVWVPAGVGAP
jgi:sensor histidine kinase regulating citrate/malate metabolism